MRSLPFCFHILCLATLFFSASPVAAGDLAADDIAIEDLLQTTYVSASKQPAQLSDLPASITILSEEDILRSGALSIPEALRGVPGLSVYQITLDRWSITNRSRNGVSNNGILILLDGRPLNSTVFSSVSWQLRQIPVETIDRIEIIRGSGTSLWGADALGGVINIFSKTASQMRNRKSVTAVGSNGASQFASYGTNASQYDIAVYGQSRWLDDNALGSKTENSVWHNGLGLRYDYNITPLDRLTVTANVHALNEQGVFDLPYNHQLQDESSSTGGFLQLAWDWPSGFSSGTSARASYSRSPEGIWELSGIVDTIEGEVLHTRHVGKSHTLTVGGALRHSRDSFETEERLSITPSASSNMYGTTYIQDKIAFAEGTFEAVLGIKLDWYEASPITPQPSARVIWHLPKGEIWAAISRSEHVNDRWSTQGSYTIEADGIAYTYSGSTTSPERLVSLESGYRRRFAKDLSMDTTIYTNLYESFAYPVLDSSSKTISLSGDGKAKTIGIETALDWSISDSITIRPSIDIRNSEVTRGATQSTPVSTSAPLEGTVIASKLQLLTTPFKGVQFDSLITFQQNLNDTKEETAFALDLRLAKQFSEGLQVELLGKNLLQNNHETYGLNSEPSLWVRTSWNF